MASKTSNYNLRSSSRKKQPFWATGWGCFLTLALAGGWIALLIFGPLALPDAIDAKNTANTVTKGPITLVSEENNDDGTFYILTITPDGGTAVKAAVPQVVYTAVKQGYYAEAEFEANGGLYRLSVWQTQGGPLVARIQNHSQEADDLEGAINWTIAFVALTVIIAIVWLIGYLTKGKQGEAKTAPARKSNLPQINWNGYMISPQGGVTSDGHWYNPPPKATELAAKWGPAQLGGAQASVPRLNDPNQPH